MTNFSTSLSLVRISNILPSELYTKIKARHCRKTQNRQREASTINGGKEANFTNKDLRSRIDDKAPRGKRGGRRSKRGKSTYNSHPYDQTRRPDEEYVERMQQQYGEDYIECSHRHYPGHTIKTCRKLQAENKGKTGYNQQRGQNSNYQLNFNGGNIFNGGNGGNIANITQYKAL
jgi:hypothetical protein